MRLSILQNIIEIQREAAKFSAVNYGQSESINWVMNAPDKWPHAIIGTVKPGGMEAVLSKIEQHQLPPIWIMSKEADQQIDQLEKNGFREITRWEGMWVSRDGFIPFLNVPNQIVLKKVQDAKLGQLWWKLVKPIMMPNREVPPILLNAWVENNDYHLLLGLVEGEPVSAGMAFMNDGLAGLYFIATLPEYRGKGFASFLVSKLMETCFENGADEIILHASTSGFSMYQKLGFIADGAISTYWKVGLF